MRILKTALVVLAIILPGKVHADCPAWTLAADEINIGQSNNTELFLTFDQKGKRFGGNAQYRNTLGKSGRGLVSGNLQSSAIAFRIIWADGNRSFYKGQISSKGRLSGVVEDAGPSISRAKWSTHNRQASCQTLVMTAQRETQCQPGYARRDLFAGDDVCVSPAERIKANRGQSQR